MGQNAATAGTRACIRDEPPRPPPTPLSARPWASTPHPGRSVRTPLRQPVATIGAEHEIERAGHVRSAETYAHTV